MRIQYAFNPTTMERQRRTPMREACHALSLPPQGQLRDIVSASTFRRGGRIGQHRATVDRNGLSWSPNRGKTSQPPPGIEGQPLHPSEDQGV